MLSADAIAARIVAALPGAEVVVKDSTGTEIMDQGFTLDGASALAGHVDLPAEAALGEYNAEISIGTESYETLRFQVAEYRKPEFKVEITPERPRYRQGETAEVNAAARRFVPAL